MKCQCCMNEMICQPPRATGSISAMDLWLLSDTTRPHSHVALSNRPFLCCLWSAASPPTHRCRGLTTRPHQVTNCHCWLPTSCYGIPLSPGSTPDPDYPLSPELNIMVETYRMPMTGRSVVSGNWCIRSVENIDEWFKCPCSQIYLALSYTWNLLVSGPKDM